MLLIEDRLILETIVLIKEVSKRKNDEYETDHSVIHIQVKGLKDTAP